MKKLPVALFVLALLSTAGGQTPRGSSTDSVLEAFEFSRGPAVRHALPAALREISGLASTGDGRVLGHGDERAVVAEIDPWRGTVTKAFSLGRAPMRGDFEGIALVGDRLFLVTSDGRLFETREGANGAAVPFSVVQTGLGKICEIEGLAYDPTRRELLLGCKQTGKKRSDVAILRWSLDRRAVASPPTTSAELSAVLAAAPQGKNFQPSSVERDPATGRLILVAGPERLITELTPEGRVVATKGLDRRLHPQPEGLTFLGDSVLVIADEGGKGAGTISLYRRAR
jgi:uncharacterized protein YjiK